MKTKTAISKITALLLAFVLVVGTAPMAAFAEEPASPSPENAPLGTSAQPMNGQIGTFAHEPEGTYLGIFDGVEYTSLGGGNARVSGHDPATLPANVVIPATITVGADVYNVTSIGEYAFNSCTSLQSITIPNSVTSIGEYAFSSCTSLQNITIPNSVTSIGEGTFFNCKSLTDVTIGDSVTTIGGIAFALCAKLQSFTVAVGNAHYSTENGVLYNKDKSTLIAYPPAKTDTDFTIPNSVTTIGEDAFALCAKLQSFTVAAGNANYSTENGVLYNKDKSTLIAYPPAKTDTDFTIPNSVTTIGKDAFSGCASLTRVTIPNSVTTISDNAFYFCTSLTSVTIPNSVTTIGEAAFGDCTRLTSVTIPDSVVSIGRSAFSGCRGLTSVTIPNSVTTIGDSAFYSCSSLTSVAFLSSTPPSIGADMLEECTALTTINVPLGSEDAYKAALPDYASLVGKDMTPPISGNGSSSSSSGGSNKPDTRPVVGGTTTGTTTSKPLTAAEATKLFEAALAAKPAGATTLSIKVQNKTSVSKAVLAELASLAKKNGVTLTVHFDTIVGGKVVSRLSVNPATATGDLNLTIKENKALAARFAKFYSNQLAVYTIPAAGSVAIKLPENLKSEDLVLYSYNAETNTYSQLTGAKPWVDTNGYLHFDAQAASEIVISQGKLVKK